MQHLKSKYLGSRKGNYASVAGCNCCIPHGQSKVCSQFQEFPHHISLKTSLVLPMLKMPINAIFKLVKKIAGRKCRGGVPELDVTKPVPGPRVDNMFAPTARGVNTAPSRLGPAVRRRGGALKYQTDCWVSADAWCLGFVWAREPKPDCCGVVTFAYVRLCAPPPPAGLEPAIFGLEVRRRVH